MQMDDSKFAKTQFPSEISKALKKRNANIRHSFGEQSINFKVMAERAAVWNQYAEDHGFLKIGSIYTYDKYDPSCLYIVIDVIPKGYKEDSDDTPAYENWYITLKLSNIHNIQDFLETGNIGNASTIFGIDILEYDRLSDNFREFLQMSENNAKKLTENMRDMVLICKDSHSGYQNYYLMRVDYVEFDYVTGQYLAYQKDGHRWLHIGNSAGTYRYFDWKEEASGRPFYIHADENGILQVRSDHYDFFSYGKFVDLTSSGMSWEGLMHAFKACNGVNEKNVPDPMYKIYDNCERAEIYFDDLIK